MSCDGSVAVVGGTGFIGSAIVRTASERGFDLRVLCRKPPASTGELAGVRPVVGELQSMSALSRLVRGSDALIHAASYVGPDPAQQLEVNVEGTRRLAAAARGAGVERLFYVSTASVYGSAFRNGATEGQLSGRPRSHLSASRLEAERIVLAAGGTVLRPHMVFGARDRWFLTEYAQMTAGLGCWINGGETKVSVIDRETLAASIIALLQVPCAGETFHACYRRPVSLRRLAVPVLEAADRDIPETSIGPDEAMAYAASRGLSANQMAIAAYDNWLDSTKLWSTIDQPSPDGPIFSEEALLWYSGRLA